MKPRHGGQLLLELRAGEPTPRYDVALSTAAGEWKGNARIEADGRVEFEGFDSEPAPPEWMLAASRALLRSVWRDRIAGNRASWPRRLERWRPGPGAA
jgi:hypothetical protein